MSVPTPNIRLMYLGTIALCAILSLTGAHGEPPKDASTLKYAVVNPGKLLAEYKYTKDSDEALTKLKNDIMTELTSWDQHKLLSEADQSALGLIAVKEVNKTALTPAETSNKQKIEDAYKRLFDEYLALQTRQGATPAETARLTELNKLESDTKKRITDRQAREQESLQKRANDVRQKMDQDVRDGITAVAKQKGFNLVFSSEVVLYCDQDITEEVLKNINSKIK